MLLLSFLKFSFDRWSINQKLIFQQESSLNDKFWWTAIACWRSWHTKILFALHCTLFLRQTRSLLALTFVLVVLLHYSCFFWPQFSKCLVYFFEMLVNCLNMLVKCTDLLVNNWIMLINCTYLLGDNWIMLVKCTDLLVNTWIMLEKCTYLLVNNLIMLVKCTYLLVNNWIKLVKCIDFLAFRTNSKIQPCSDVFTMCKSQKRQSLRLIYDMEVYISRILDNVGITKTYLQSCFCIRDMKVNAYFQTIDMHM